MKYLDEVFFVRTFTLNNNAEGGIPIDSTPITLRMFGTNFVTSFDSEFADDGQNEQILAELQALLESMNVSKLRFPGGSVTEHAYTQAVFNRLDTNPGADNNAIFDTDFYNSDIHGGIWNDAELTTLSSFFAAAGQIGANVTLVIPTRVAFETTTAEALLNLQNGNGEEYGSRSNFSNNYLAKVKIFVDEALRLANNADVSISTFEIGNEFWGSGQMNAKEYAFVAAELAKFFDAEYPDISVGIQKTNAVGDSSFDPKYDNEAYIFNDNLGESYTRTAPPEDTQFEAVVIPGHKQFTVGRSETVGREIRSNGAADLIDAVVDHHYFGRGLDGIDGSADSNLSIGVQRFLVGLGRTDLDFYVTEYGPRENDSTGLEYAQSLLDVFFELASNGVDEANFWPLTFGNVFIDNRTLVDTSQRDLTYGGEMFKMLSESVVGLGSEFDYQGQDNLGCTLVDVHGFADGSRRKVVFVADRTVDGEYNTWTLNLGDFALAAHSGAYFVTTTTLTGDITRNGVNPEIAFGDGTMFPDFGAITTTLEDHAVRRIEITSVTNNHDLIQGREGSDLIEGFGGNDSLIGDGGDDSLFGGIGFDHLVGGAGRDEIRGGSGHDDIIGGIGADSLNGDAGDDTISGGDGFDGIKGGVGNDSLKGNGGNDTILGGLGQDTLNGGIGADSLTGGAGNDVIVAMDGFDVVRGGTGDDVLTGNSGNDTLYGDVGNDTLEGGIGADVLEGGTGDDSIRGLNGFDVLVGGADNDYLEGNSGNDTLDGGTGNDRMRGGQGADVFVFNFGNDLIRDYSPIVDTLEIEASLLTETTPRGSDLANYSSVVNGNVVLDFGGGNSLTLNNVTYVDILFDNVTFI
ncbi:calcium-binding protein [uncultured Tateyamaria sp.]|uniref:calcium-binding protein n=1 Tax=uncultured Tateyamaria sp. TaxID=455651 RepID=UPI00262B8F7B|nr:calcium-binding protein [uncultured Tateyamaria sp.]